MMMLSWFLVHCVVSVWMGLLLSVLFGQLSPLISCISLLGGSLVATFCWQILKTLNNGQAGERSEASKGPWAFFEFFLLTVFAYLVYRHFGWMLYVVGAEIRTLSPNNLGDLPLHLGYIRFFANGGEFWPINPGFSAEPLRYPFAVDFYSALWEVLSVPSSAHLFLFGLITSSAAAFFLLRFGGGWALGGLFFSGSWVGWEFFAQGRFVYDESMNAWKNLFLSVWVTQRGFLLALPLGLLVFGSVRRLINGQIVWSQRELRFLGCAWGSLAFIHLHSFFVISILLGSLVLIHHRSFVPSRLITQLLPPAVFLAAPVVYFSTDGFSKASTVHLSIGWMRDSLAASQSIPHFLFNNFGPIYVVILCLPLLISATHHREMAAKRFALLKEWTMLMLLAIFFLNVMVAPWPWDNIKVLLWIYLGFLGLIHAGFEPLQRHVGVQLLQVVLAVVLFFSGFVVTLRSVNASVHAVRIGSTLEVANAQEAIRRVPQAAIFAAAPTVGHPLVFLGRVRALGYEGHLWSHGIEATRQKSELRAMMLGLDNWREAAHRLGATHVFWGPMERAEYGDLQQAWKSVLPNLSTVAGYEVYEISQFAQPFSREKSFPRDSQSLGAALSGSRGVNSGDSFFKRADRDHTLDF